MVSPARRIDRLRGSIVAAAICLLAARSAAAQANDRVSQGSGADANTAVVDGSGSAAAAPNAELVPPADDTSALSDGTLRPPPIDLHHLDLRWGALRLAEAGSVEESDAWENLRTAVGELGFRELPRHATALVQDAIAAHHAGAEARATTLLERARALAPSSSQADFAEARMLLNERPGAFGQAVLLASQGWQRKMATMSGLQTRDIAFFRSLYVALTLLGFALVVPIALRHAGRAAFDLRLLLLRAPSLGQTHVLLALAVLTPAAIAVSPLLALVLLVAVVSPYLRILERVAVAIAVVAVTAAPFMAQEYGEAVAVSNHFAMQTTEAVGVPCDETCDASLVSVSNAGEADASLVLAWQRYQGGDTEGLAEAIELLELGGTTLSSEPSAICLRGNLAYVAGDLNTAERHWRRVLELAESNQQRGAAAFNLSRLYARQGNSESQRAALVVADSNDRALTASMSEYRGRSQNRVLAACVPSAEARYGEALGDANPQLVSALSAALTAPVHGSLSAYVAPPASAGLLLWVALSAFLRLLRLPSEHCAACGTPTSRFVYKTAYLETRCILCYQLHAVKAQLEFSQQHARDHRARTRVARKQLWSGVAGLVLPGAGLLYRGSVLLGVVAAAVASCGMAVLALPVWIFATPLAFEPTHSFDAIRSGGVAVLALGYGLSWLAEAVVAWRNR